MKITIKDIAKYAGVSTATVSMIVNKNDERISSQTREKVLKVIEEYNYVPNRVASSLVTKKTKTIGLVIPDIANPFFPEIARGVEDKANDEGYTVILCNSDNVLTKEDSYIDMLQEKMVDGIVFTASSRRTSISSSLEKVKVPVITVDRDIPNLTKQGKIAVNNEHGAYNIVSYMIEKGYKKICHITGPLTSKTARDRYNGYVHAHKENNISLLSHHLYDGAYTSIWGIEAVDALLKDGYEFDSIFCGNDMIAVGAMKGLEKHGLNVPNDIGVVGFDDIEIAQLVTPELTTVRQPKYEMGYKAAEMLIKMIDNEHNDQFEYLLNTEMVIRNSIRK